MGFSVQHLLLLLVVVLLLFGRGKLSELMGDVGRGIRSFKKGMADDEAQPPPAVRCAMENDPTDSGAVRTS